MRARVIVWAWCVCVCALAMGAAGRRTGGGGSRSGSRGGGGYRGGSSSGTRHKTPTGSSTTFLGFERAGSSHSGNTHNRGSPGGGASAPPKQTPQTNGPVGFEHFGNGGGTSGNHKPIGFDKVNSEVQNKPSNVPPPYPGGSHPPSYTPHGTNQGAPPGYYAGSPQHGTNQGPPPAYYPGSGGFNDHPPAYPGRPVNAPPSYTPGHPPPPQPGFNVPQSGHPSQPGYNFGNPYPQNTQFGYPGHGSNQAFGNSYPANTGSYPGQGAPFGGSYPANSFGGNPFGGAGHAPSHPNYPGYNPGNFGYSGNPGYFGQSYNDGYHKKSRFGGLGGLPIPIPIPIPIGGGGFGGLGSGFGGYGGFGGPSYNHHLLDSFVRTRGAGTDKKSSNSSTDVFVLNNSTVTPCTTDHFVYDALRVTVLSCTAEFCTAVKVSTSTNRSDTVHSAALTVCFENNVTFSYHGDRVVPVVSPMERSNFTVCRNVTVDKKNETAAANKSEEAPTTAAATVDPSSTTAKSEETTTTAADAGTTDSSTTPETTSSTDSTTSTTTPATTPATVNATSEVGNATKEVCEQVGCYSVRMCMPSIELVDNCNSVDCPFRRTGYQPCVTLKVCRSASVPLSTFASLNTTVSQIDEFNVHRSVHDAANLTLISYHRPAWTTPTTTPSTP